MYKDSERYERMTDTLLKNIPEYSGARVDRLLDGPIV